MPWNDAIDVLLDEAIHVAQEEEEQLRAHLFDPSEGTDYTTAAEGFNGEEAL